MFWIVLITDFKNKFLKIKKNIFLYVLDRFNN